MIIFTNIIEVLRWKQVNLMRTDYPKITTAFFTMLWTIVKTALSTNHDHVFHLQQWPVYFKLNNQIYCFHIFPMKNLWPYMSGLNLIDWVFRERYCLLRKLVTEINKGLLPSKINLMWSFKDFETSFESTFLYIVCSFVYTLIISLTAHEKSFISMTAHYESF